MQLPNVIKRINENFFAKVFVCILISLTAIFGSLNYVFIQFQKASLKEEMIKDGELLAQVCADNARLGIFAEDTQQIEASLKPVFQVKGVLEICALNYEKKMLVRQKKPGSRKLPIQCMSEFGDLESKSLSERLIGSTAPVAFESHNYIKFWSAVRRTAADFTEDSLYFSEKKPKLPADERVLGFVGITIDKTPLIEGVQAIIIRSVSLFLLFLFLGSLLTYFIVREVTKPLNKLINEVKSRGIEVASKDELGLLSGTYDALIEQLTGSFKTINTLKKGLEKKVDELQNEIRERQQAERALQESEETARSLLNIPINAAALIDANGIILDVNENMAQTFQKPRTELIGLHLFDQFPSDKIFEQRRYKIEAAIQTGKRMRFDDEHQGLYWDNYIYPIYDNQGKISKIAILARDITRRHKAEMDRREMEVKALTQSKLASLGEIAAGVAHEIYQPLSYIKVIYESALRDIEQNQADHEELKADFREAIRQVGRITHIIDHLRIFGRENKAYFEQIYLPTILDNTMILVGEKIRHNNINLIQNIEEPLPLIEANAIDLEQVFINLFQNAFTALKGKRGGEITITMNREEGSVRVTFSDNGPGILPEIKDKVFEPFFTTGETGQGTGLGLAIVYGIIKEHKGAIDLESKPDQGVTFTITLPKSNKD